MIKRLIGAVGTIAVVAIVVFAVLGRENYSSAVNLGRDAAVEESATTDAASDASAPAAIIDSVAVNCPIAE